MLSPLNRKLLTLPSKLLHETRRWEEEEALLKGGGGDGIGPSSVIMDCVCCCKSCVCDPRRETDPLEAVNIPSSPTKGFNLSINWGLEPETGRLRFFSSPFRSLTFMSSKRVFIRMLGVLITLDSEVQGAGEGAGEEAGGAVAAKKVARLAAASPVTDPGPFGVALAGNMICGYLCCHSSCHWRKSCCCCKSSS